jgi:uncharacterized repeat protein (TIGR01451 family)
LRAGGGNSAVVRSPPSRAGPGNILDELPFTLTTDNGELSSLTGAGPTVSAAINEPNGILAVKLRPTAPGRARITLQGPCGLESGEAFVQVFAADLSVVQRVDADAVILGDVVTYAIHVTNNGPDDADEANLTDTLPAGADFVAVDTSQGSCDEAAGVLTCALGGLAVGATAKVEVVVLAVSSGELSNSARIDAYPGDHKPADNEAVVKAMVLEPPADEDQPGGDGQSGMDDPSDATNQPSGDGPRERRGSRGCGAGVAEFGALSMVPFMLIGAGSSRRTNPRRRYDPQS